MTEKKSFLEAYRERPYRNIFIALVAVILIDALAPKYSARGQFADLMLAAVLVAALLETVRARRNVVVALALGLPAIVLRVIGAFSEDSRAMNTTLVTVTALFLGFLIWNLLHDLTRSDRSTSERIFGALCAYVFIGLLFAAVYTHMEFRQPGSFATSQEVFEADARQESNLFPLFTYFSFVTLTTLGYGDITPVAEHARTLAWFEALVGQLYLAVMVAGFVADHVSQGMNRDQDDPPPDD
jgi:uncharacterized membrane protein